MLLWSSQNGDVNFPGLKPKSIDGMSIGQDGQAPVGASEITLDDGTKTATAIAGAATLDKSAGVVTSEALTTAAGAGYTLTLADSKIAAGDQVFASVSLGSSTTGTPAITTVTPSDGHVAISLQNIHATAPFNGTLKIGFAVLKNE